jgi:hypothetical protein
VLTVTLPVAERAKPRRIHVTTGDQGGQVIQGSEPTRQRAVEASDEEAGSLAPGEATASGAGAMPTTASPAGAGPGGTAQVPPGDGSS